MSGDMLEGEGTVESVARGDFYRVSVKLGAVRRTVLARRSGRLVNHHIKIISGDRVLIELSPYDTTRGRITRRL